MTALYPNCIFARLRRTPRVPCRGVGLLVILYFILSPVFAATLPDHVFTDLEGRTLTAKIIQVAEPNVYLQSGTGVPFPVKIGAFVAKDQAYIQQWALNNQKSAQPFNIFALKEIVNDPAGGLPQQAFKVTLKNLTNNNLTNLRIDYVVLRQPTPNAIAPLPRISGTATITVLAKNGQASIDTTEISAKGDRVAVWIRVYNAQGVLMQDWSSAPNMTDAEEWSTTDKNNSNRNPSRDGFGFDGKSGGR